jgi:hypothetical protein
MAAKSSARYVFENVNSRMARLGEESRSKPIACHTNAAPSPTAATRYKAPMESKANRRSVTATTTSAYTRIWRAAVATPRATGSIGIPAAA